MAKYTGPKCKLSRREGTDLFLKTNYRGLDPIVNGNSAAVGGSGGTGIDYGNFPMPKGFNFGFRMGF